MCIDGAYIFQIFKFVQWIRCKKEIIDGESDLILEFIQAIMDASLKVKKDIEV